jgi:Xaa-Pro aminopeptidase
MPYIQRLKKVQQLLNETECDALLVQDAVSLYYLTGLAVSAGTIIISKEEAAFFVDSRYFELCQQHSPIPTQLIQAHTFESFLERDSFREIRYLGFDNNHLTHKVFQELHAVAEKLGISLRGLDNPIGKLRIIKDAAEIALLKEAADLGSIGFDYVLTLLREGITEEEIAQELEIFWKRRGSKAVAFDPIIAFGANSSMPHHRAGKTTLKKGDLVLIDIGVNYKHYHSDMTRTVFFSESHPQLIGIYHIVKEAQQKAMDLCHPGTLIGDLDAAARDHITSKGFGDFFTHSLGHGIGLDIHEAPWLRNRPPHNSLPLLEGMVITIEPGIYLPGVGGVRIEDSIVIGNEGHVNLTNRTKEITII